jgi:hypothetical protein
MKNREASSSVKAHQILRDFFSSHGSSPTIVRIDNESSNLVKQFLQQHNLQIQFVPPHNHRANKAERTIRDFKNHFIGTFASTHSNFPMSLSDELLPQVELTINLLRPFGPDHSISAYQGIYKTKFNFSEHPIACGTLVVIPNNPIQRGSWDPHGETGLYVGPALDHYRCFRVFSSLRTKKIRISDTLAWFPESV